MGETRRERFIDFAPKLGGTSHGQPAARCRLGCSGQLALVSSSPVWERLQDQLDWSERKASITSAVPVAEGDSDRRRCRHSRVRRREHPPLSPGGGSERWSSSSKGFSPFPRARTSGAKRSHPFAVRRALLPLRRALLPHAECPPRRHAPERRAPRRSVRSASASSAPA